MAKTSKLAKNAQRRKLVAKHAEERAKLTAIIKDPNASFDEKWAAQRKLAKMPRDASATRIRNRCALTGRPRAYYRKFGLSRIALRDEGLLGNIPGLVKASW
ncbi:MAG: 30S ribosomal protein S14 [bacterium]|nr:30S ribosomal protein S14 [Myxococcales bacterium]MCB9551019.1 30S ribosomal protein S14 [Myxococcales bacterium]